MAKQTKQVILTTTARTTGKVVENRFVTFAGKQAKANEAVLGVAIHNAEEGDLLGVDIVGIALVEAGGEVAAGATVSADAQGCAVAGTQNVAGTAVGAAAAAGDLIRVLLKG
ncbi:MULTISPECIES: capsid cement protein [unclassified Neisseria]|uniref:capsid cement protein n=1 Tax=unclassified Neisseria TaxID=2623750 RepID=UPI00107167FA|nr:MULTISPECIES: capsid cement protein [unclassified Neisseria]MBF0802909.1 DUF2190 family protein [Neisseria sp. 19428wB4_WF04]TFU44443.1 DUF2190 family protein [Neisseria sp. WF04]